MNLNEPFLLIPAGIQKLWGGNKLKVNFSKNSDAEPLAESWECSTHSDGLSYVGTGIFKGKSLKEVIELHPEFLGLHLIGHQELPILVKFIDAGADLSIQVHPDDNYARIHEKGNLGKHEMWYVLEANKDSKLVYGLQHRVTKETLKESIENNNIDTYLQKVKVHSGDVFFVKPGTIHAIGAGILLVEIQQNSNITYRLYDYNRLDKNGKKRELHVKKALDVVNYNPELEPRQPMRVVKYAPGCASEFLCRCKYFQVERLLLNTKSDNYSFEYASSINSFEVLLCVNGCGKIVITSGKFFYYKKGDCIFYPANSGNTRIYGNSELIRVFC